MTIRRISSGAGLPTGFPFSLASEASLHAVAARSE
jgi:hypothetical protein